MSGGEIAASVVGKIAEILVGRAVNAISRQFSYLFCYKRNIRNLSTQLTELESETAELQQSVIEARWNLETIAPTVRLCLDQAQDFKIKAFEVEQRAFEVAKGCLINLKKRYVLSRKATMLVEEIVVLKQKCANHARFSHPAPPVGIVDPSSTTDEPPVSMIELKDRDSKKGKAAFSKGIASTSLTRRPISMSFRTRMLTIGKVIDALMDDGVNMIGLYGMGGVGKTTLVNEVREKIKAHNLFSEVAMAVVSQNPDFLRIQGELADMLGLKYQESTSVVARAERLCERLTRGGRVLVVLDNIWDGIKLDRVGIPVCKACKVIFTTRIEHACIEMGAQTNIRVSVLSDLESWNLFKEVTGDCVENKQIEGIARNVAKECGGLPLAIVTLGKALSGKAKDIWKDALYQLKMSAGRSIPGMHKKVHSSIELSYEFLGSSQAQSLLLLCCLFKEDANIPIEQLVRYGIGLQLFDDVETMERTRSRVYSIVDHLKSSSLLLDDGTEPIFQEEKFVKLHDIVRDVCLSIASREPLAYLVRHDRQLKRWPHNDTPNPHTAISLMSDVMEKLPGGLVYPNLKLLQLQLKHNFVYISRKFFPGMEALRVLDFQEWSFGGISGCLPETLEFLTNLRTLSLEHCTVGKDISVIGRLQKLGVLSFFMSSLDNLPREVGQLRNLKVLDLRCENEAPVIGTSILSRLYNLEELYMGRYDSWEGSTEGRGEGYSARITELNSLPLTTLQIQVRNPRLLLELEDFLIRDLQRFNISTHWRLRLPERYGIRNSLYLEDVDISWLILSGFNSLVSRSENLFLVKMKMRNILSQDLSVKRLSLRRSDEPKFYHNAMNAFPNLELLHIEEMIHLIEISYVGHNPAGSFVRLRELELSELPDLKNLWRGPVHPPSFGNLKFVQISHCKALRSLFTEYVAKCLVQLQDLFIFYGDEMEGVISDEESGDNNYIEKIKFPKLNYLWLDCLPKFRSFYPVSGIEVSGDNNRATIQSMFNKLVWLPNLDMLQISDLDSLKQIVGGEMQDGPVQKLRVIKVKNCHQLLNITDSTLFLRNLEDVVVEGCKKIKSVFDLEGLKDMEQNAPVILDNLETIELNDLQRLTHIWRMVPKEIKGFQNLRTLDVWACHSLRYILPLPIAKQLVNLHDLTLGLCDAVELVIDGEEENSCAIVFPQLQVLKLLSLNTFISFSSSCNSFEFPLLQKVEITKCPNMATFCPGLVNAPILEGPVDDPDINEWIWEGNINNGINRESRFSHAAPPLGIVDPSSTTDEPPVCMIKLKDGDREKESKVIASASLTLRRSSMTFRTRMLTMEKVMDALMDDGVNIIGLFGMSGVGKTTLVNDVREEVKARNLFSEVAMTVVSQNPDFLRIQGELADMLGLKYQESTSVDARAEQLRERLTKGGSVLVILDDIWDGINLDIVGIPVCNACKVIFATRIERACNEMGAQTNIRVSVLSDLESWNLFKEITGDGVENEDIESSAREVVQECGGLPLAIVTLGKALAGRAQQRAWEDALSQLKMSAVKQKEEIMRTVANISVEEMRNATGSTMCEGEQASAMEQMEVGTNDEDMQDVDMLLEERRLIEEVLMKNQMEANQRLRKIGESSGTRKNDDDIVTVGTSTVTPLPSTQFSPNPATERKEEEEDPEMVAQLEVDIDDPINYASED